MNRLIKIVCVLAACLGMLSSCARTDKERSKILKIYNWADYIDEGILDEFPVWYKEQTGEDIRIIYQVFDINEIMLTKIERGHEDFDLICPSEYIIERMLKKKLLLPIDRNFGKTPDYLDNISPYIREQLNKLSQPGMETTDYVVPYMWGTAGLLYNKQFVTQDEVMTWDCLWNPRYKNKILMKDSYRDAYGTAIIYGIIGCCMMFAAGLSWKYILGAAAAAGAAVAVAFAFFSDKIGKGYQWYRILAVIDPENTTGWAPSEAVWKNIIYQQQRGEIAIGSGGIFGNGLFGGRYYSVPNAHNDFILSWIGNSAGFVGCCVVLGVLFALVVKTFATGARSEDLLGSYICAGIGGALMAQIAVNVGMNLRLLPVIGVTLPFYSAGGSSVLMLYICVGLVLSVYSHNTKSLFG